MRLTARGALLAALALAACGRRGAGTPEILGEINNEYLTTDEYLHHFRVRGGLELEGAARDALKRMLLVELVDRRLLLIEARRRRIRPARDDVRRAFGELGSRGWESAERAAAWNAQDDFYEQRQIEELMRAAVPAPANPGAEAVRAWRRAHPDAVRREPQVRLRQVVVHSSAMAHDLKSALDNGSSLDDAARRARATAPGGAAWAGEADLPGELWDAVRAAVAPAVVGPVASEYGFHVAVVEGRRAGGPMPVDEADALARRRLLRERRDDGLRRYVAGLRRDAVIRIDRAAIDRL